LISHHDGLGLGELMRRMLNLKLGERNPGSVDPSRDRFSRRL